MLCEFEQRWSNRESCLPRCHCGDALSHTHRVGQILIEELCHHWFVIEQVHLRRRIRHEQPDHSLGRTRPVQAWQCAECLAAVADISCVGPKQIGIEKRPECCAPKAGRTATKKVPSCFPQRIFSSWIHNLFSLCAY